MRRSRWRRQRRERTSIGRVDHGVRVQKGEKVREERKREMASMLLGRWVVMRRRISWGRVVKDGVGGVVGRAMVSR